MRTLLNRPRPEFLSGGLPSLVVPTTTLNTLAAGTRSGAGETLVSIALGEQARDRVICVCTSQASGSAITILRASINDVPLTVHASVSIVAANVSIMSAVVPNDRVGALSVTHSGSTSNSNRFSVYIMYGLSSPFPRTVTSNSLAGADTVRAVDLDTQSGGFAFAIAANNTTAANSVTWTGDQSVTELQDSNTGNCWSHGYISSTNTDSANTMTATFAAASSTGIAIAGASFR